MSGIMEYAEELYSYGLNSGPDKNVCIDHFSDAGIKSSLNRFIHPLFVIP